MTLPTEMTIAPPRSAAKARTDSTNIRITPPGAFKPSEEIKTKARDKIQTRRSPLMSSHTTEVRDETIDSDLETLLAEGRKAAQLIEPGELHTAGDGRVSHISSGKVLEDISVHSVAVGLQSGNKENERLEVVKSEDDNYTVDEIDEWLSLTGFYDAPYRQKLLSRRRRMKAIEEEKQQLLQEEQEETSRRQGFAHPSQTPDICPSKETPPFDDESSIEVEGDAARPRKRARSSEEHADGRLAKTARSKGPPMGTIHSEGKDFDNVRTQERQPMAEHERLNPNKFRLGRNRELARCPPRTSDQTGFHVAGRGGGHDLIDDYPQRVLAKNSGCRLGDGTHSSSNTRFFMLRSWNRDNITVAQRECAWSTQLSNERIFVDAFRGSQRVVFFFSANSSKAFQGHAEMTSLPAAPGVPDPKWRSQLHWPSTEAFGLKWMGTSETAHMLTAHLKNPWNQGLPVYVGKDGQEVEPGIGAKLCEILEDYDRRKRDSLHY